MKSVPRSMLQLLGSNDSLSSVSNCSRGPRKEFLSCGLWKHSRKTDFMWFFCLCKELAAVEGLIMIQNEICILGISVNFSLILIAR